MQPVVAQRALLGAPVALPPLDHPVRAGGDAVAAAVADVLLHDDRSELGAEERSRRADVQAARVRAVLADVRRHEPAQAVGAVVPLAVVLGGLRHAQVHRHPLLDERDVPPRVGAEVAGVVVRHAQQVQVVGRGHAVPLLARHLARLAADAHRGVGEEADARRVVDVPRVARDVVERPEEAVHAIPALRRYSAT